MYGLWQLVLGAGTRDRQHLEASRLRSDWPEAGYRGPEEWVKACGD